MASYILEALKIFNYLKYKTDKKPYIIEAFG